MTTLHTGDGGSSISPGESGLIPCTVHPGCWVAPYPEADTYAYELSYSDMIQGDDEGPGLCP
jgi:hypothetical protein